MAFTIHETTIDDAESLAKIYIAAHGDDDLWISITEKVKYEDHVAWIAGRNRLRHSPNRKQFKVIETATG